MLAVLQAEFPELSNILPLAVGGQKYVASAVHPTDGDVVIKIISPFQDSETTRREILAVQQVQSARVPQILAQGQIPTPHGTCLWLREMRVNGQTLREALVHGPLAPARVLKLGVDILDPLVAAENAGIVHRDVKPDNIMVDTSGDFWLLDFGLARHLGLASLTATASPFGKFTPGYAPPEQFRNIKVDIDSRADLFALGVTLYEAATGANPFAVGADALERLRRIETTSLPSIVLPISQSQSFSDLISAMTQRRREHRPASADFAYQWLLEIVAAQPV